MADKLTGPIQESVITLLAINSKQGRVAAGLLKPEIFDESYRDFAGRLIAYQRKHGKAPGLAHLDDLVDDIVGNPKHKRQKQYLAFIEGVMASADSLNAEYVLGRVNEFARKQRLKGAVLEAAERYENADDNLITDVEAILTKALRVQETSIDAGVRLSDLKRSLKFLNDPIRPYATGIRELDHRDIGLTSGKILLLVAPKGSGKSWWLIHLGKNALLQKAKVLHVTLEMPEEEVIMRYCQSLFAISKRKEAITYTKLVRNEMGTLVNFRQKKDTENRIHLRDRRVKQHLQQKLNSFGLASNLIIKSFPTKSLTVSQLDAYLDILELTEHFIPNVILLDYPDLMWINSDEPRISLGRTYEELRGLCQRRNLAGGFVTQTNRKGWDAPTVKGSMVAEDASKLNTADMALLLNRTQMEHQLDLARIHVEKNRSDEDGFDVVLAQNYKTGQFALDSARMNNRYLELISPKDEDKKEGED